MENNSPIGSVESGKAPTMGQYNLLLGIVIGVALVCMLGFITLLISYFTASQATFQSLKDQVVMGNSRIDELIVKLDILTNESKSKLSKPIK